MTAFAPAGDPSVAYLLARLGAMEGRVRRAVERRRAADADPSDRFRGLYISEADVERLLAGGEPIVLDDDHAAEAARFEAWAQEHEGAGRDLRLRRLAADFGLGALDVDILLLAMAPDLDARFERFYGYLQDDVTRRRAGVGLVLELCGHAPWSMAARGRLVPGSPLVDAALVRLEDPDRPLLSRPLRVPDRVVAHLLGGDEPDPTIATLTVEPAPTELSDGLAVDAALARGIDLLYLVDRQGAAARAAAAAAFERLGRPVVSIDLGTLARLAEPEEAAAEVVRDARLRGGGVVAGPVDQLTATPRVLRLLADAPCPVVLIGQVAWDPAWSRRMPLISEAPMPSSQERERLWRRALEESGAHADGVAEELARPLAPFRMTPEQVTRATASAGLRARSAGRHVDLGDLQAGARAENATGLERLARRVEPQATWHDLVLPAETLAQLHELTSRARLRDLVVDGWGMGRGATHGRGVTALFAGDPGTGKTMSAEVVAADLGLDLYVVDLSTVVDKYIGETEKNLDRIFSAADGINGVLLFDEADALFGKRSEVRDARDRYANVEIAYLLQRMESLDGLALLTTNLRSNLDEAFARRLDALIDFPMPEETDRLRLWELHLPPTLPRADDIDLPFLAARFRISGGNIRNVCLTAAYLAAEAGRPVTMADLVRGTEREYVKLGRLTVEAEFGPYLSLLSRGSRLEVAS